MVDRRREVADVARLLISARGRPRGAGSARRLVTVASAASNGLPFTLATTVAAGFPGCRLISADTPTPPGALALEELGAPSSPPPAEGFDLLPLGGQDSPLLRAAGLVATAHLLWSAADDDDALPALLREASASAPIGILRAEPEAASSNGEGLFDLGHWLPGRPLPLELVAFLEALPSEAPAELPWAMELAQEVVPERP